MIVVAADVTKADANPGDDCVAIAMRKYAIGTTAVTNGPMALERKR